MKPLTIIGGGLAGLTLGVGLRRRDVPVAVWEAGRYPRHRVCGEFISGRGQQTLSRLGLSEMLECRGAVRVSSAAFFSGNKSTRARQLPETAIGLSRFDLDAALAEEFVRLGGELREGSRWRDDGAEGIVRATGRRLGHDNGGQWFGLRIHARNVPLRADLEMHFSPRGYVGVNRVNGGDVNVCGIFRKSANASAGRELLRGQEGSALSELLANAEFDEKSFCAVAGISLRPQRAAGRDEICVGDAITMIPPVTGNGMSMAFESAEMAIEPLAAWSRGKTSWATARNEIARRCDKSFSSRLTWAKWLQAFALCGATQSFLLGLISTREWFWNCAFRKTR